MRSVSGPGRKAPGFTILEMLVAMVIFLLLMGILLSVVNQSGNVWQKARDRVDSHQSARFAFDLVTRTLSQSTLNVQGSYDNPSKPTTFIRRSDLHFVIDPPPGEKFGQGNAIFFQAPAGRTADFARYGGVAGLLNAAGYYVTYGKNPKLPAFLRKFDHEKFRLMQFLEPAESLKVYTTTGKTWFTDTLSQNSHVIADNIIFMLFWPRLSAEEDASGDVLSKDYTYDSRLPAAPAPQELTTHQQPPLVRVTMIAIDETASRRLPASAAPPVVITNALAGLFTKSTEADFTADLATLEARLTAARIGYRVFDKLIPLRESKWNKR